MQVVNSMKLNDKLDIKVYTKLMEHLDVCESDDSNLDLLRDINTEITEIAVVTDADGCDLVFANNPGKGVICYYFGDSLSLANGNLVPAYGEKMTAGIDSKGLAHVFVLRDNNVYYSKETRPHSASFGTETRLEVSQPKNFKGISQIKALPIDQGCALFAVCETTKDTSYISCRIIGDNYDYLMPVSFGLGKFDFSGTSKNNLCVHQVYAYENMSYYAVCDMKCKQPKVYNMNFSSGQAVSDIYLIDDEIFCLGTNADLWQLSIENEQAQLSFIAESNAAGGITFQKGAGYIHAAAVDSGGRLLHFQMSKDSDGYITTMPFPIDLEVSATAFCGHTEHIILYYYSRQSAVMMRLCYNPESRNWNELEIKIPDPDEIQRSSCYSTEVTLLDAEKGTPMTNVDVDIWTEQQTYVKTTDGFHLCDKEHKLRLQSDLRGQVSFAQYVDKIDTPVIYASLPDDLLGNEELLSFCQYEAVSSQLDGITAEQILNAKTTDSMGSGQGNLLSDKYRTEENAKALSESIRQMMDMAPKANTNPRCRGTYLIRREEAGRLKQLKVSDDLPAWSLTVDGDKLHYEPLSKSDAAREINELRTDSIYISNPESNGLFSSIADFFRGVAKKIVNVVKVIFDGIKTVVKFVIDAVEMVFEFVAKTIGEVLNFIETIFTAVAVFFVTLFAWLAALFQWNDVKRTQKALNGAFQIFMECLPDMIGKLNEKAVSYLKDLEADLDEKIDAICQQFIPGQPIMEYIHKETPSDPSAEETVSNNYLLDKMLQMDSAENFYLSKEQAAEYYNAFSDILSYVKEFTGEISASEEFAAASQYFEQAFSSLDNFFQNLMVSILQVVKGLLHLIIKGTITLTSMLTNSLKTMCSAILDMITKSIHLPFFTTLYRLMTGDEMTILNMITFVLSVIIVLLSKLVLGKAPFENDKDVEDFLSDCQQIFDMTDKKEEDFGYIDIGKGGRAILTMVSAGCGTIYYTLGTYLDNESCVKPYTPSQNLICKCSLLDAASLALEALWCAFSFPWLHATENDPVELQDIFAWILFLEGVLIDAGFLAVNGTHIDKTGDLGRECTSIYGFFHFLMALIITINAKPEAEECIPEFFGSISEMVKFLIDFRDPETHITKKAFRIIVVATDASTAVVILVCGSVAAKRVKTKSTDF